MDSEQFEKFVNQDFNAFSDWLYSLNAYEFAFLASFIGFIISPTLTINQQNSLGNFFELLGQVILTINAQGTTLQQKKVEKSTIKQHMESNSLEEEILKLKNEVIKLRKDSMGNARF